jgi:hypothetical protein
MYTINTRRWLSGVWGLVLLLSAFNLYSALWGRTAHDPDAWGRLLTASSSVLLAAAAIFFVNGSRRRFTPLLVGTVALILAIWGMLSH